MKIAVFSLYKSKNLGEMLYTECVKRLIRERFADAEFVLIDIHARDKGKMPKSLFRSLLLKLRLSEPEYKLRKKAEDEYLRKYYAEKLKGCTAVIIPGGGYIKSNKVSKYDTQHRYHDYFQILFDECQKQNCIALFNAVGHVNTGRDDAEVEIFGKVFNHPAVRLVTCRDEKEFFDRACGFDVNQICCSAAFAGRLYGIHKNEASNTVGLGLIRPNAYEQYGFDMTREKLEKFYEELISAIENAGYAVKLYTNGLEADQAFAAELEQKLGRSDLLLKRPETCEELLDYTASFKAVIVARMHAAIAAYSLDVPAITLCWNNKHEAFMRGAGALDRAIYPDNFNCEYVTERLEDAVKNGWDKQTRQTFTSTSVEAFDKMCTLIKQHEEEKK